MQNFFFHGFKCLQLTRLFIQVKKNTTKSRRRCFGNSCSSIVRLEHSFVLVRRLYKCMANENSIPGFVA